MMQFVRDPNLAATVIAWFSAGHLSHVDCLLDDGTLLGARNDSVGGKPPGVQIRPPDYTKFTTKVVMTIEVTDAQREAFLNFLMAQVGKPYDTQAIWGFLFNRDWRQEDSWICSELQAAAAEYAKIVPQLYLAANKITPVSWALAASAIGGPRSF